MKRIDRPGKHAIAYAIRFNKPDEVHLAFGVSRKVFVTWCRELGLQPPAIPHPGGCKKGEQIGGRSSKRPERDVWERECAQHSRGELMAKHKVSSWTIWKWCKDYGISMPRIATESPTAIATEPAAEPVPAPLPPPALARQEPVRAAPLPSPEELPRLAPERPSYWCQPNIRRPT
jgi:hypothetical protein